jgi:Cu/Ag efflux protein CusF
MTGSRWRAGAILALFAATFASGMAGCARQSPTQGREQAQVRRYRLKGTVVSVNIPNGSLVVDMHAIPGYMAAMAMSYPVHEAGALAGLQAGDAITAEVVIAAGGAYLDNVRVTKKVPEEK